jgi:hypothetical protein
MHRGIARRLSDDRGPQWRRYRMQSADMPVLEHAHGAFLCVALLATTLVGFPARGLDDDANRLFILFAVMTRTDRVTQTRPFHLVHVHLRASHLRPRLTRNHAGRAVSQYNE